MAVVQREFRSRISGAASEELTAELFKVSISKVLRPRDAIPCGLRSAKISIRLKSMISLKIMVA